MSLCAAELALVRISTGQAVAPLTIAVSVAEFLLLSGIPAAGVDRLPLPTRVRFVLHTALGFALCVAVGLGLIGPAVNELGGRTSVIAGGIGLLALLAGLSRLFDSARRTPYPAPAALFIYLNVAACSAWLVGPGSLPGWTILVALAAVGASGAALIRRTQAPIRAALALGVGGVLLASFPPLSANAAWPERPAAEGPDLVIISVDALRFDAAKQMTIYQKLAAEGTEFTAAQSPAPWTLPSVASLLTGVPPAVHGAGRQPAGTFSGIAENAPALAGDLAARGYDTIGIVAQNPFAGASFGMERGFDSFYQPGWSPYALPRGAQNLAACPLLVRLSEKRTNLFLCRTMDGEGLTDHVVEVLDHRRDRPIFLWVHFLDAHLPYVHTADPSVSAPIRRLVGRDIKGELDKLEKTPQLRHELWAANKDEVRFVDAQAQRILAQLGPVPTRGRIVVFTADHGEEFFEHGGFEHGHALVQEVTQVPLVISGLNRPTGIDPTPVTLMDIPTTLLAAAGGENPAMEGVDLADGAVPVRSLRMDNMLRIAPDRMFAIRRGAWKAIWDDESPAALFNLDADPLELHNVADQNPEIFSALMAGQPRTSLDPGPAIEVSDEQRLRLEALGYVVPDE